jgi:hypothetical protein
MEISDLDATILTL